MAEFSSLFFFGFTLLLTVVLHKRADIKIDRPQYPLYDMERIDDGDSVREIFVDICQVGIIHIRQKIFNGVAFCRRYGSKVRLCDISPPASEDIDWFTGMEILDDQGVFTVGIHVDMHFID